MAVVSTDLLDLAVFGEIGEIMLFGEVESNIIDEYSCVRFFRNIFSGLLGRGGALYFRGELRVDDRSLAFRCTN